MPKIHITKTTVERIELPTAGRVEYFDDKLTGFGVRVSSSSKTYFTLRRVNGTLVRTKIDTTDKISAEAARKRAEGLLADMGRGIDPNEEKRQAILRAQEERQQSITLQQALNKYLQKGKLKPRTIRTYQDLFRLYLADWLIRPAADITRDMVKERHKVIAVGKRGRRVLKKNADTVNGLLKDETPKNREGAADNCFRTLRAVLNYTFENEENDSTYMNPVNVLSSKKRKAWYQVERRRTLIKNSDLSEWSKAVEGLSNPIVRDFLLFLLYTGLRRNEAARLRWDQVDFREGCFTIPTTKNGEPHTLPMSDYLKTLLIRRKAEAWADNPFVFPGNGKEGHLQEPKKPMATVTANTGIVFTCHDLRRTFATIAESLDLSGYTVKALLNHKQQLGDVTGGYIILNVERLREPMQKITNAIQERIRKQHGQIVLLEPLQRESM